MQKKRILVLEDDDALREALLDTVSLHSDLEGIGAANIVMAKKCLLEEPIHLVVSDVNLEGKENGIDFLKIMKKQFPGIPVLMMTAFANVQDAIESIRQGAIDYIVKPFEPNDLIHRIEQHALPIADTKLVATNEKMKFVFAFAKKVAMSQATVLIYGESGTGKEVVARYIHNNSDRKEEPFVAINCAAIPEHMLEATLFGYEKGAFTGAYQSSAGKFEQAQKGTLLLDEISEMSVGLQAKLLRVLQEKEVERIGGKKPIALDVRVLATTNRDLKAEIKSGKFREDLFYRLSVLPIQLPPLRDRKEDILPLAEKFLSIYAINKKREIPQLSDSAKAYLLSCDWHGNVRELENALQRAIILQTGGLLEKEDLQQLTA